MDIPNVNMTAAEIAAVTPKDETQIKRDHEGDHGRLHDAQPGG